MPVLSAGYELPGAREMLKAVAAGRSFLNEVFEGRLAISPDVLRRWMVSVAPVYGATGQVEAITLVSQELPAQMGTQDATENGEEISGDVGVEMAASE